MYNYCLKENICNARACTPINSPTRAPTYIYTPTHAHTHAALIHLWLCLCLCVCVVGVKQEACAGGACAAEEPRVSFFTNTCGSFDIQQGSFDIRQCFFMHIYRALLYFAYAYMSVLRRKSRYRLLTNHVARLIWNRALYTYIQGSFVLAYAHVSVLRRSLRCRVRPNRMCVCVCVCVCVFVSSVACDPIDSYMCACVCVCVYACVCVCVYLSVCLSKVSRATQ